MDNITTVNEADLTESTYLIKVEMVDGTSQLMQITKEQAIALGIDFPETTIDVLSQDIKTEGLLKRGLDVSSPNESSNPNKKVKIRYNYKVINPQDLDLTSPIAGRPKKVIKDEIRKKPPTNKIIKTQRTRYGRITRPPEHMKKVFENIVIEDEKHSHRDLTTTEFKPLTTTNQSQSAPALLSLSDIDLNKKKRAIPAQYRCSTCKKAYLGRNKMSQHLRKHPDHGIISQIIMEDSETWCCLIETCTKTRDGQKGIKFCQEILSLIKNARTLVKYFFKPSKASNDYFVDSHLSNILNVKEGYYRFNENELCKDISIFSFLEIFDDTYCNHVIEHELINSTPNNKYDQHIISLGDEIDCNKKMFLHKNEAINTQFASDFVNKKPINCNKTELDCNKMMQNDEFLHKNEPINSQFASNLMDVIKSNDFEHKKPNNCNKKCNKMIQNGGFLHKNVHFGSDMIEDIGSIKNGDPKTFFEDQTNTKNKAINSLDQHNNDIINALKGDELDCNKKIQNDEFLHKNVHFGSDMMEDIESTKNDDTKTFFGDLMNTKNKAIKSLDQHNNDIINALKTKSNDFQQEKPINCNKTKFACNKNANFVHKNESNKAHFASDVIKSNTNDEGKTFFGKNINSTNNALDQHNNDIINVLKGKSNDFEDKKPINCNKNQHNWGKDKQIDIFRPTINNILNLGASDAHMIQLLSLTDGAKKPNNVGLNIEMIQNNLIKNVLINQDESKFVAHASDKQIYEIPANICKDEFKKSLHFDQDASKFESNVGLNMEMIGNNSSDAHMIQLLSLTDEAKKLNNVGLNMEMIGNNSIKDVLINQDEHKFVAHASDKHIYEIPLTIVKDDFKKSLQFDQDEHKFVAHTTDKDIDENPAKMCKDDFKKSLHFDLNKLHNDLLSDELILPDTGQVASILDTSTSSDDVMNVDQFVNERFKKLTEVDLDLPINCFNFHTS